MTTNTALSVAPPLRAGPVNTLSMEALVSSSEEGDLGDLHAAPEQPKELSFLFHADENRFCIEGVSYHVLGTSSAEKFYRQQCCFVVVVSVREEATPPPFSRIDQLPDAVQERLAQLTEEAESKGWAVENPRLSLFQSGRIVREEKRDSYVPPVDAARTRSRGAKYARSNGKGRKGAESIPARYEASAPSSEPSRRALGSQHEVPAQKPARPPRNPKPAPVRSKPVALKPVAIRPAVIPAAPVLESAPPSRCTECSPIPISNLPQETLQVRGDQSSLFDADDIHASLLNRNPRYGGARFSPPRGPHGEGHLSEPPDAPGRCASSPSDPVPIDLEDRGVASRSSRFNGTESPKARQTDIVSPEEAERVRKLTEKCRQMGWIR